MAKILKLTCLDCGHVQRFALTSWTDLRALWWTVCRLRTRDWCKHEGTRFERPV